MIYRCNCICAEYRVLGGIGLLLLMGIWMVGCAVTPSPSVDVYMEPIGGRFGAQIDAETGAATVERKGVAVTLKPLNEVELFALTEDPRVNPYLFVERNGAVEPIYTVFEVTVHNRENRRVVVEDMAVLIDANGAQYANLPNDYFDSLYANVNVAGEGSSSSVYPYARGAYPSYPGYYRSYIDAEVLEWGQIVIEDSIFEGGKLFTGARRSGFLIFDRLESEPTDLRVVMPEVRIIGAPGKSDKLEFKFDFRQILP